MKAARTVAFGARMAAAESQRMVGVVAISGIIGRTTKSFFDEADMNS
jgi:hypothetical protein